jgi:putative PEP-CTERM system TPR-repeat lipoprotein
LPGSAPLIELLGTTQLAAGEVRQAVASFIRLAETLPKAVEPRVLLARAHMAAKQPEEALKALRAALELRPDLAAVQRDIVALYLAAGRTDDALRQARASQAATPQQPHGHVLEGEVLFAQKKFDLAERKYRATLKQFDLPQIAVRAHAVIEAAGKPAEAEALAKDWIRRHPKDAAVLGYLADRDTVARRYESAAARYHAALERLPDNALFLNNLAWVSHKLKQPEALEHAERAHELAPESPAIMDTLGTILADRGQMERGLQLLGQAAQLAPEAHQIRLNFARALLKGERKPAARKELEGLAKLDPRLPAQQEAAKLLATF